MPYIINLRFTDPDECKMVQEALQRLLPKKRITIVELKIENSTLCRRIAQILKEPTTIGQVSSILTDVRQTTITTNISHMSKCKFVEGIRRFKETKWSLTEAGIEHYRNLEISHVDV